LKAKVMNPSRKKATRLSRTPGKKKVFLHRPAIETNNAYLSVEELGNHQYKINPHTEILTRADHKFIRSLLYPVYMNGGDVNIKLTKSEINKLSKVIAKIDVEIDINK
jgi:hypothetical protein